MSEPHTLSILELRRSIQASREDVFKALTTPEIMNQWFYGMDNGSVKVTSDLKGGGE